MILSGTARVDGSATANVDDYDPDHGFMGHAIERFEFAVEVEFSVFIDTEDDEDQKYDVEVTDVSTPRRLPRYMSGRSTA